MRPEVAAMIETLSLAEKAELLVELNRRKRKTVDSGLAAFSHKEVVVWEASQVAFKNNGVYLSVGMRKTITSVGKANYEQFCVNTYAFMYSGLPQDTLLTASEQLTLLSKLLSAYVNWLGRSREVSFTKFISYRDSTMEMAVDYAYPGYVSATFLGKLL